MAKTFATLEIDGQRVDFWVLEPVLNSRTGRIKRYMRLRRDPSQVERQALPGLARLARRVLDLETSCSRAQLSLVSRVGGMDGGWELTFRCKQGVYRVWLEPAHLEGVEVVDIRAESARLRVSRALFPAELASASAGTSSTASAGTSSTGGDTDELGGTRP